MIRHYLKIAFRSFVKYKSRSIINLLGLTIGFTAFIFGGYWLYWETHFDTFHPQAKRIFAITTSGIYNLPGGKAAELNQLHKSDADFFSTSIPEIENTTFLTYVAFMSGKEGNMSAVNGYKVDSSFFAIFQPKFLCGGYKGIPFNYESVILNKSTALKFFQTIDCAGKSINLGDQQTPDIRNIAGVIDDYPGNTEFNFDILVLSPRTTNNVQRATVYILLKENTKTALIRSKIENHKSQAPDPNSWFHPERWKFHLRTLSEVHLTCNPELTNRFRNIYILAFAGLFAFISALMNHLVLFIGLQQKRLQNNLSLASLGASRKNLVVKGITELLLPLILSFIASLCLIEILYPWYEKFTSFSQVVFASEYKHTIGRDVLFERSLYYMGISTVVFILISLWPIIRICGVRFRSTATSISNPVSQVILRRILIAGQIFIGSLFFIVTLSLYKQLHFLKHSDKGLSTENIIQIYLGYDTGMKTDYIPLKAELLRNPLITDVTLTANPVLSPTGVNFYNYVGIVAVEGRNLNQVEEEGGDIIMHVDNNFFSFFNIRLKQGAWLPDNTPFDYIVNETGFRKIGLPDLLQRPGITTWEGREITQHPEKVIGVIYDYHYCPLQYPLEKIFFHRIREKEEYVKYLYIYVKYIPGNKEKVMKYIRSTVMPYDTGEINESRKYTDLMEMEKEFNKPEETIFTIFGLLALVCILISSFGIYSLVSLSAEQRKKEIAIRKVNGATFKNILHLFFKEYIAIVCLANVIALPMGYILIKRWLETYAYRTTLSWWLFILVFFVTCLIVIFSIFQQISKAAKANPAEAVKTE